MHVRPLLCESSTVLFDRSNVSVNVRPYADCAGSSTKCGFSHMCVCVCVCVREREREGGRERARCLWKNIEDESPVRGGSPQQEFNSGVILQYYPIISWKKNRYIWTQCAKLHLQLMFMMKGKTFFAWDFYFSMFYKFDSNIVKATSIGFVLSGFALFG